MKLTEKQKNCKYCHPYSGIPGDYYIEKHPFNRINFCPICGRPLNEEEE